MKTKIVLFLFILFFLLSCKPKGNDPIPEQMALAYVKIGTVYLNQQKIVENIPIDKNIIIEFISPIDTLSVPGNIILKNSGTIVSNYSIQYMDNNKTIVITPTKNLENNKTYSLDLLSGIKGADNKIYAGTSYSFLTINGQLVISQILINKNDFQTPNNPQNIDFNSINIEIVFSEALDATTFKSHYTITGNPATTFTLTENNKKINIQTNSPLDDLKKHYFSIDNTLKSANGFEFQGFENYFYTSLDSTYKFPQITDDQLLELIQKQTFKYFWDFGHPTSGLARERNTSGDVVTTGGSGFGIMSLIVGMERNFITRAQGLARMETILNFLATADRFHGAWPHWMNGSTGKVIAFSTKDNGGDLVETSFLVQGLLTFRQYLNPAVPSEKTLIDKINTLWRGVEWSWYTQGGQNVLYWHWSPSYNWDMNFALRGYYEAMITYVLATASPTHGIATKLYHEGWCRNGDIKNGKQFYGYTLPLGYDYGGPLFFAHYSFLGLDPRKLQDKYANYWTQNVNHSLINWSYCKTNPKKFPGYSKDCWGLTSSDNQKGYNAHQPTNDLGVISPTAAVSSLPYTPEQSMKAIRHFYYLLGDKLWGTYGFYDAFNPGENWWANSYLAIDQGPMIVMIENYRAQKLWNLFMSCPEVTGALDGLGFTY